MTTQYTEHIKSVYTSDEILEAKLIIFKSLRSGKLLVEYRAWEKISEEIKSMALEAMTCPLCHKVCTMEGKFSHMFGVDSCCKNCDDRVQYPQLSCLPIVKYATVNE